MVEIKKILKKDYQVLGQEQVLTGFEIDPQDMDYIYVVDSSDYNSYQLELEKYLDGCLIKSASNKIRFVKDCLEKNSDLMGQLVEPIKDTLLKEEEQQDKPLFKEEISEPVPKVEPKKLNSKEVQEDVPTKVVRVPKFKVKGTIGYLKNLEAVKIKEILLTILKSDKYLNEQSKELLFTIIMDEIAEEDLDD